MNSQFFFLLFYVVSGQQRSTFMNDIHYFIRFFLLILHALVASGKRICKLADVDPYFMCRPRYSSDGVGDGGWTIRCAWTSFKRGRRKEDDLCMRDRFPVVWCIFDEINTFRTSALRTRIHCSHSNINNWTSEWILVEAEPKILNGFIGV